MAQSTQLEESQGLLLSEDVAASPSRTWKRPAVAALTASAALVFGSAAVLSRSSGSEVNTRSFVFFADANVSDEAPTCAEKDVEDCSVSQCCQDIGYQCYAKADGWAVCKETCDADEMKEYDPEHAEWSCDELGERARCANNEEDCSKMGCCVDANHQCYKKNDDWAMCFETCDSGEMQTNDPKNEPWSCDAIGDRNFESQCTWAGEECSNTKCCNNQGFTCAVKDENFAGCVQTNKKTTWMDTVIPIPGGWEGTVLGGGRGEFMVPPAADGAPVAGTTLFCIMVYLPNSTEESLMWLAKKNGVSVFGCDDSMTLHAWQSGAGGWDTGETTLVNTDVFTVAFDQVRQDGRYKEHDWLVKADPDCVFFADRLRGHLEYMRPPAYMPIYIKNNDMDPGLGNRGFLGALEIFSNVAMQTYFANADGCKRTLGSNCGEDGFFKGCMDALGVGFMLDPNVFHPDYDPSACGNGERVGFHPIKDYREWQCCVDIVMGITTRSPAYGKCDDGQEAIERPWMSETSRRLLLRPAFLA